MADRPAPNGLRAFDDFRVGLETAAHGSYERPEGKVRSRASFEEQKAYLVDRYSGFEVRHSFQDAAGQIFDCIPIEAQPALGGGALAKPPGLPGPEGVDDPTPPSDPRHDRHGNLMGCEDGFVPIRRVTLDEVTRFESLSHYRMKGSPSRRRGEEGAVNAQGGGGRAHRYAHAVQNVANLGASATLNVWAPAVNDPRGFSLSQLWVSAGAGAGMQTVEAGWHVYPERYNHARPVLFTYWTPDGYGPRSSYGREFVRFGSRRPIGGVLENVSVFQGAQAEIQVTFALQDGNWWLYVGGSRPEHAVGYYPAGLFGAGPMATAGDAIDFGGEIFGPTRPPAMGSGAFASGGFKEAAYQRLLSYYDLQERVRQARLVERETSPASYTVDIQNASDWGEYIYFGGPGA